MATLAGMPSYNCEANVSGGDTGRGWEDASGERWQTPIAKDLGTTHRTTIPYPELRVQPDHSASRKPQRVDTLGRTGNPIKVSRHDHYAVTKMHSEAIVAQSGIRHWVSPGRSGRADYDMWRMFDSIMIHNSLNGVFEWSTAATS